MSDLDVEIREAMLDLIHTMQRGLYLYRQFSQLSRNLQFELTYPLYIAGRIPFTLNLKGLPFEMDVWWGKN